MSIVPERATARAISEAVATPITPVRLAVLDVAISVAGAAEVVGVVVAAAVLRNSTVMMVVNPVASVMSS